MKLEQIDTSTTAGKAEVMRLAAEGRRVAFHNKGETLWWECAGAGPVWSWSESDYAIIAEPVGPDEVWVLLNALGQCVDVTGAKERLSSPGGGAVVRYVRAD